MPITVKNDVLSRLSGPQRAQLDLHAIELKRHELIYRAGDPIDHVYFIEDGLVSIIAVMSDGHAGGVAMVGPEGVIGFRNLLGAPAARLNSVVLIPGTALRTTSHLANVLFRESQAFSVSIMKFVGNYLDGGLRTAACNRLHPASQRFARWILMASDRAQTDTLTLTHEVMAVSLGVRRTGTTAIVRALQRAGLIEGRRRSITIVDRNGLEAAACECYRADRLDYFR